MTLEVVLSGKPRTAILSGKSMGMDLNVKTVTTNYTVSLTDDIILVNCTAGNRIITIADASDKNEKVYTIKKIDSSANYVHIIAAETVPIDAPISCDYFLRRQFESITLISAGHQWLSISKSDRTTIERARDGSENINIYEKTSNELAYRLTRQAANKYKASLPRIGSTQCNVCEKIALPTPTVSGWNTNPAPLSECVNDNYAVFTTAGLVTVASGWAYIMIDLGEIYTLTLAVYSANTGSNHIVIQFSLDNAAFYNAGMDDFIQGDSGNTIIVSVTGTGRYLKIGYRDTGLGTLSLTNCSVSAIGAPIA